MSRHASTTFADRLREAQGDEPTEALARRIGISLRVVQKWRAGQVEPNGESLARLCKAVDRPVEFFYPERDEPEREAA